MLKSDINIAYWEELADIHSEIKEYGIENLMGGKSTLKQLETHYFNEIPGKKVLHLQCHFGIDTISIAKFHQRDVVGVDYAKKAIDKANELSASLNVSARFICSNIYNLENQLDDQFDIVYTSYGVLMWLDDLKKWANIISRYLKPGGKLILIEEHPFAAMLASNANGQLTPSYPYAGEEPYKTHNKTSYADRKTELKNTTQFKWGHGLQEILNSLTQAQLVLQEINEYPYCFYQMFPDMTLNNGWWHLKDNAFQLPMMFSLIAKKI